MANIGVCLEPFFTDLPYRERIRKVKALGFRHYEFWFHDKRFDGKSLVDEEKDFDEIAGLNERYGLTCTDFVFNHPEGGIVASLIDRRDHGRLQDGLGVILPLARRLGCTRLISGSGNRVAGLPREEAIEAMTAALAMLAPACERAGVTLLLEPFNTRVDHPDYFLDDPYTCLQVLQAVNSPAVRMLFDIYHMQIMSGNIVAFLRENLPYIGHFHLAGVPGRREPDAGELNYPFILQELDRLGYAGTVGLEYFPSGDAGRSLERTRRYLAGGGKA